MLTRVCVCHTMDESTMYQMHHHPEDLLSEVNDSQVIEISTKMEGFTDNTKHRAALKGMLGRNETKKAHEH